MKTARNIGIFIGFILLVFLIFSCSYPPGYLDYSKYNIYSSETAGNLKYIEIMPIKVRKSGFIWESCDEIVSKVASEMYDLAKSKGGNALMNVKWYGENDLVTAPTCKKQYGWFALYILPGLTPWTHRASAEGIIIKIIEDTSSINIQDRNIILLGDKASFITSFLIN